MHFTKGAFVPNRLRGWDGLGAIQMAEEEGPDVVLLDISLPKLSGIEAARRKQK